MIFSTLRPSLPTCRLYSYHTCKTDGSLLPWPSSSNPSWYTGSSIFSGHAPPETPLPDCGEDLRARVQSELTPETVTKAKEGYKTLEEQFAALTSLNREIAEYISSPFEEEIIGETMEETVENFRDKIRKILQTAYAQVKGVKLYVIPADKQSINRLEEKLAAIVEVTER